MKAGARVRSWAALAALAGCLGAVALGCGGTKREATVLVAAVRRFHEADNPGKPAAADVIATVPCTDPDVCAAKDACVKACGDWGDALRRMAETQAGLSDLKAGKIATGDPAAQALPGKLAEAQAKLTAGREAMPDCDTRILKLKTKLGI